MASLLGGALGPSVGSIAARVAGKSAFGASGLTSLLGAAAPWAGPVLLGAQLLKGLIGRGRKQASLFVDEAEKPITSRMTEIFDKVTAARKAGTLTFEQAQEGLSTFDSQASEFAAAQTQFSTLGSQQKKVIEQSRAKFDPLIAKWREGLQGHLDALRPASTAGTEKPSTEAPTAGTLLAPLGQTPEGQARQRAQLQRKRSIGGGRESTILGGTYGGGRAPIKTLLGY